MRYHVLTLFPEMIEAAVGTSVIGRGIRNGALSVEAINIRDFSANRTNRVDDYPYGGGAGMVMEPEPVYQAVQTALSRAEKKCRVVYLTPQAEVFNQRTAERFAMEDDLILLCGHYEGIDERVLQETVTDYVSIGDYVLTGGELAALVVIDAVSRFVPGVLGNETSSAFESLQDNLLEYPHYTRPEIWRSRKVPDVLLSGDHARVEEWRYEESLRRTKDRRPDLLKHAYRIRSLWYGDTIREETVRELTGEVSRYGVLENYNRRKLQKSFLRMGKQDAVLLFLAGGRNDPEYAEKLKETFRNLNGSDTICIPVLPDRACGLPESFPDFLEKKGFLVSGPVYPDEDGLKETALAIREYLGSGGKI